MNIKMIAVDLDGTLLRDDKTVSDRNIDVLIKCRNRGIKVIYATARGKSALSLVPANILDGYVQMNGAVAFAGDTCVHSKLFSTDYVRDLLLAATSEKIELAVEHGERTFANFTFPDDWEEVFRDNYEVTDFKTLNIDISKVWSMPKSEAQVEILKMNMPEKNLKVS